MPTIKVLPHEKLCPQGADYEEPAGISLCQSLLDNGIAIEHACEMSRACTTCHVVVRKGFDALEPSEEEEDDLLDKAWGLTPLSRLSCQIELDDIDLVVEIPKYTINLAREEH